MQTKTKPTDYELAVASVMHACNPDEARTHLRTPFAFEAADFARGEPRPKRIYLAATDGHRAALVRVGSAATEHWRTDAPPIDQLIPWHASESGVIDATRADSLRHFPAKWDVALALRSWGEPLAYVTIVKGSGKRETRIYPFGANPLPTDLGQTWVLNSSTPHEGIGIAVPYLLDALDFVGTQSVTIWRDSDPMQPFLFTAHGATLTDAPRIALVMPRRV
jgi:hypothetical protein